ncbi:unnamed protein product, partial [Musa textilis]
WVSQGNKWCDFCKIYIANNTLSIRTRELGQRHKDNVAKRLATMRKESAAWEKEQKEAARAQRRATRTIWLLSRERIPVMDCNLIRKLQMKPSVQLRLEMFPDNFGPIKGGLVNWPSSGVGYLNTFKPHESC